MHPKVAPDLLLKGVIFKRACEKTSSHKAAKFPPYFKRAEKIKLLKNLIISAESQ